MCDRVSAVIDAEPGSVDPGHCPPSGAERNLAAVIGDHTLRRVSTSAYLVTACYGIGHHALAGVEVTTGQLVEFPANC